MRSVAPPRANGDPTIVLMTPGQHNSAYYEHSFLADRLGIEMVEGRDLFVRDDVVYAHDRGPARVDVIYRRIDDELPRPPGASGPIPCAGCRRSDGRLSRGQCDARERSGNRRGRRQSDVHLDAGHHPFYLGEAPPQNVPTCRCREEDALAYALDHLDELVVKEVNGSGGYGMLVGLHATKAQIEAFAQKLKHDPQQLHRAADVGALHMSDPLRRHCTAPCRPAALCAARRKRRARRAGRTDPRGDDEKALVVNSSQGGGTKDTWVIDDAWVAEEPMGQGLLQDARTTAATTTDDRQSAVHKRTC